jgi:hypothetical protein
MAKFKQIERIYNKPTKNPIINNPLHKKFFIIRFKRGIPVSVKQILNEMKQFHINRIETKNFILRRK